MLSQMDPDFGTPQQLQQIRLVSRNPMTRLRAAQESTEEHNKVSEPFLGALQCGTNLTAASTNDQQSRPQAIISN